MISRAFWPCAPAVASVPMMIFRSLCWIARLNIASLSAIQHKDLKIIMGTDATAGAHGQNAREIIYRVQVGGQSAMDAIVAATSLNAEALGMKDRIGAIAAGMEADLIAVDGDPLK